MKWKDITFFDNKVVCDLIDGNNPPGIMRVLDDTCRTVHSVDSATADAKFMEKLIKQCSNLPHLVIKNTGANAKYVSEVPIYQHLYLFSSLFNIMLVM